jgi:hypothetical protein
VNGCRDRIKETSVGVGCEVHGYIRAGRDGAHHFNIEHYFSVRSIRVASRLIVRLVN